MSTPSKRIAPESGLSMPASRLSSVDLPEPDGPIKPRKSPRCTSNERSCSTGTTCPPRRYDFETFRTSMSEGLTGGSLYPRAVGEPVERLDDHPVARRETVGLHQVAKGSRALEPHALRAAVLHEENVLHAVALGDGRLGHGGNRLALGRGEAALEERDLGRHVGHHARVALEEPDFHQHRGLRAV